MTNINQKLKPVIVILFSKEKYFETMQFIRNKKGTDVKKIYKVIRWLCQQGKVVSGGRNFSIAYDQLDKKDRDKLVRELIKDPDMYKLKRYRSDISPG